jgi:hypothetical protein
MDSQAINDDLSGIIRDRKTRKKEFSCSSGGSFRRTFYFSQLTPLSGVAVQARQSTLAGTVSILCSLAGRYGHSAELD